MAELGTDLLGTGNSTDVTKKGIRKAESLFKTAITYAKQGEKAEALRSFDETLRLFSDDKRVVRAASRPLRDLWYVIVLEAVTAAQAESDRNGPLHTELKKVQELTYDILKIHYILEKQNSMKDLQKLFDENPLRKDHPHIDLLGIVNPLSLAFDALAYIQAELAPY